MSLDSVERKKGQVTKGRVFRWPKPLFFMVLGSHGS